MHTATLGVVRLVKGTASAEELAVLAVVLLARSARPDGAHRDARPQVARWHRLERAGGFEGPRSWQSAGVGVR